MTAHELGRLVRAVEQPRWGSDWLRWRNSALVAVMDRATLPVGEAHSPMDPATSLGSSKPRRSRRPAG